MSKAYILLLIILFFSSASLVAIGSNILVRLMIRVNPEKHYIRMRPPKRLIKKLQTEKSTDRELLKNLKLGLTLEKLGLMGIGLIFIMIILAGLFNKQ